MNRTLLVFSVLALLGSSFAITCGSAGNQCATVYLRDNELVLEKGKLDEQNGVAWAVLQDRVDTLGLSILYVNTSGSFEDAIQMNAAGFVEGALTQPLIHDYSVNYKNSAFDGEAYPEDLVEFMEAQFKWVKAQVSAAAHRTRDVSGMAPNTYWEQVGNVVKQVEGIVAGYEEMAPITQKLEFIDIYMLMMAGDMEDLGEKYINKTYPNVLQHVVIDRGSCSAFVRLTEGNKDLFVAHNLWNNYQQMNRIFKHYDFSLKSSNVAAHKFSFSSKPADLQSKDDFWVLSSGLVVTETSLIIINETLYDYIVPETVPAFMRSITANRMAHDGEEWTTVYALYNSGTHNAQFIITDMNKFSPGVSPLPAGTVHLMEDVTTYTEIEDVTAQFERQGFWAGYNVPYFPKVNHLCGYDVFSEKYGHWFVYDKAPRANIFRARRENVNDLDDMKAFMRNNEWETDPLSEGYPFNQISSRADLIPKKNPLGFFPDTHGGIDGKITNFEMSKIMDSWIVSGPSCDQQPEFSWEPEWPKASHVGMPDKWNFPWVHNVPVPGDELEVV
jgi:hypothetical protein